MDEILEKLEGTFVGEDSADKTNFIELYKNWGRLGNQEERRRELLETQRHERQNKIDKFRGILDIVKKNEDKDIFKTKSKAKYTPKTYVAGFNLKPSYYNVLMQSEWMIEKPEDFHDNWFITPCPKGKRVLAVANNGTTKLFTKCGRFLAEIRTGLPGGNPSGRRGSCSVIDCFYVEKRQAVYVLDLLAWNNQPMTDCDTEFRHFWLKSQLTDMPGLNVLNSMNQVTFHLLPMTPCTPESLNIFMMTFPHFKDFTPGLDGLLLYHKKAHYISGETPLVGWLFPYMVHEILGSDVMVNPKYINEKPVDYVNQADFIQKFELKYAKKRDKFSGRKMNTSGASLNMSNSNNNEENKNDKMDADEGSGSMEPESMALDITQTVKPKKKKHNSKKGKDSVNNSMEADEAPK